MPDFTPPVVYDLPPVPACGDTPRDRWHPLACRLRRRYSYNSRGRSVLKIGGSYLTVDTPTQAQIDAASEVYLGGHIYRVTQAVADSLVATGYALDGSLDPGTEAGTTPTPTPTPSDGLFTPLFEENF